MAENRTKSGQFVKKNNAEALAKAQGFTKESVLNSVAKIRSTLDGQVAEIGDLVQEKLGELETVTSAIEAQKAEAERIHGVEAIAKQIDEATIAFEETRADLSRKTQEAQRSFAAQVEAARQATVQAIQQFENDKQRGLAAWQYTFDQQKKTAQDQLVEELRVARQAEKVRTEDLNRGWALREETLTARETEITDLRTKVASFPEELKKETEAAKAQAFSFAKRDKDHEIAILNSQHTALRTVDQNTINNLTAKLVDKDKVIEQLTVQLAAANLAQKEIATKALDTAGNVKALADIQAATQAANNGQKRA